MDYKFLLRSLVLDIQALKAKARKAKTDLGVIYLAFRHKETPWYAKVLIALVVSYALSPIDLIPDFIPVLGYLDDLILIPAGIALAIKQIPPEVILECRQNLAESSKARSWGTYALIVIIFIWLLLIYLIIRALRN
ncbi:MAG: YkvA family protein [Chitinophagales bacterium]